MESRLIPAVIAVVAGAAIATLLFVPYVAGQYRRRGEVGIGNAGLAFAALVYGIGLIAYVLLPLPTVGPDFCAVSGAGGPQLIPFNFLRDMRQEATGSGLSAVLRNPALVQVLLNVALFVPLGMFVRHLFGRTVPVAAAIGLSVSLLIECTQLTGNWFLYPCSYRLFDVDDLIANGAGGLLGAAMAPVLSAVPGQRSTGEPGQPRPVTRLRRLLAALCDLLIYQLSIALIAPICAVLFAMLGGDLTDAPDRFQDIAWSVGFWLPWSVFAVVLPLAGNATSLGQRIVLLRVDTLDGRRPGTGARLVRSLTGTGGYVLLLHLPDVPAGLAFLFGTISFVGLLTTEGYRGLSCRCTGSHITDARIPGFRPESAEPVH